jgi:hypothetical protein
MTANTTQTLTRPEHKAPEHKAPERKAPEHTAGCPYTLGRMN